MMMKVFGAILIVSGGYFLGKVPGSQNKKRKKILKEIFACFIKFKNDLLEYRLSFEECLSQQGFIAKQLLLHQPIKGLQKEDLDLIDESIHKLSNGSYRETKENVEELLRELKKTIEQLEKYEATTGKALPLVTGMIGMLLAVLLF